MAMTQRGSGIGKLRVVTTADPLAQPIFRPDTIFALATLRGRSGVAVTRLSGPRALVTAERLVGELPAPRVMGLRVLSDPRNGQEIDQILVVGFEAGHSFTGEPVAEFHTHGSPAVIEALGAILAAMPGLRLAEPGEFSRRALMNDRMDLAQAEGLADLISAETTQQLQASLRVMRGELSRRIGVWRQKLTWIAAMLAVAIDFADEEVPDQGEGIAQALTEVHAMLAEELEGSRTRERLRDGFEVAIIGAPNVGKSTLLNAIARREVAITSEFAGTTRDVLEVRLDLAGLPVTLLDTAGIRQTDNPVETIGIERAVQRARDADIRIFLVGPSDIGTGDRVEVSGDDLVLVGKADLMDVPPPNGVSGATGFGIDRVLDQIQTALSRRMGGSGLTIRERHRQAITAALGDLEAAMAVMLEPQGREDEVSELVMRSIRALDSLIGRVDVERVLDEVFASFCLGK